MSREAFLAYANKTTVTRSAPTRTPAALDISYSGSRASNNLTPVCFVAGTLISTTDGGFRTIENVKVGQRVQTTDDAASQQSDTKVNPATWRKVDFLIPNVDDEGNDFEMTTLMTLSRITEEGLEVGSVKHIDLDEMGIHARARVLNISKCPAIEAGRGRVVLTNYTRIAHNLYELKIAGVPEPIKVTATHPLYSHDRKAWVAVAELNIGERVWTASGPAAVESLQKLHVSERVYNFEVEKDHRYYVTKSRVLAHNQSPGPDYGAVKELNGTFISRGITNTPVPLFFHSFIILTDATGKAEEEFATRAGPFPNAMNGHLWAESGNFNSSFRDTPRDLVDREYVGYIPYPFERVVANAVAYNNVVNNLWIPYDNTGNNSNTYTATYLDRLNLPRPESVWALPGSFRALPGVPMRKP